MSKQTKLKQQSPKRVPAPKQRRDPLPISISVKHHLPIGADGTSTDLTVAEIEAAKAQEQKREQRKEQEVDQELNYSTSRPIDRSPITSTRSNTGSDPRSDRGTDQINPSVADQFTRDQTHRDQYDRYDQYNQEDQRSKPGNSAGNIDSNRDSKEKREKKLSDRLERIDPIDLGVESRFVRVPNAVADRLARELSPAEEKIFDQIWRLTVGFNRDLWRGKIADLMLRTGYSSRATVTKAIAGLSALGLITVEGRDTNPRGRSYRIADRAQLLDYPDKDPQLDYSIKKAATSRINSSRLVEKKREQKIPDPQQKNKVNPDTYSTSQVLKDRVKRSEDDSGYKPSSSSSTAKDDETGNQVRLIYQDMTGNLWNKNDEIAFNEVEVIPLPYLILGICYSISRATEHRIGSFKYCLPSIKEHYELMRGFPYKDLIEIAYRHLVRVKEAQKSGKWTGI